MRNFFLISLLLWTSLCRAQVLPVSGGDQRFPVFCGAQTFSLEKAKPVPPPTNSPSVLPNGYRSWACIPSVIRGDGVDTFRLEVTVNASVKAVYLETYPKVLFISGSATQALRDDGLNGDRLAGDTIFTSGLLACDTNYIKATNYEFDTNSPLGVEAWYIGAVRMVETNGVTNRFFGLPSMGFLDASIPAVRTVTLGSNIVATDHLVNIQTTSHETAICLRGGNIMQNLTKTLLKTLPDAFDFFNFFSTECVESVPWNSYVNGIAAIHHTVRVNYTGTGMGVLDDGLAYGSASKLLGVNVLGINSDGMDSIVLAHEISHQWGAFLSSSPAIVDGSGHYILETSVSSPLGGVRWTNGPNGFIVDCSEGFYGAHHASPLDQYLMGLVDGSAVPLIRGFTPSVSYYECDQPVTNTIFTVSITNIQALNGIRSPGPAKSQKDFRMCFAIESHGRLLNSTEMTFYEIFAEYSTRAVPADAPDPFVYRNWVPITRFFGGGTTWNSDVLPLIRPTISSLTRAKNGVVQVDGVGYPGRSYSLQAATNLTAWKTLTNRIASSNGQYSFIDSGATQAVRRFYRLSNP